MAETGEMNGRIKVAYTMDVVTKPAVGSPQQQAQRAGSPGEFLLVCEVHYASHEHRACNSIVLVCTDNNLFAFYVCRSAVWVEWRHEHERRALHSRRGLACRLPSCGHLHTRFLWCAGPAEPARAHHRAGQPGNVVNIVGTNDSVS
jgi:hypothetical protein